LGVPLIEEICDFMPEMGPMVGCAVTLVITGGDARAQRDHPNNFAQYQKYLATGPCPKIVVVQDLDRPNCYGSIWDEVGANGARALGCVGTITDGAIRDLDEMRNAGFKALARRLAVSHAYAWPIRWGCDVEVFGTKIKPGQLIHADKHGFIIIPEDAQTHVLTAARFMDDNECDSVIAAARQQTGRTLPQILRRMNDAAARFGATAKARYGRKGEWK
jgi:regulator of RNase E activity RraA